MLLRAALNNKNAEEDQQEDAKISFIIPGGKFVLDTDATHAATVALHITSFKQPQTHGGGKMTIYTSS